jgi:hypothetical protein
LVGLRVGREGARSEMWLSDSRVRVVPEPSRVDLDRRSDQSARTRSDTTTPPGVLRGTDGSNPFPSSRESANHRFLSYSRGAMKYQRRSVGAKLRSRQRSNCTAPRSAAGGCWHCGDGARLADGSPKAGETDRAPSERLFVQVGPRVRIRLAPAASLLWASRAYGIHLKQ